MHPGQEHDGDWNTPLTLMTSYTAGVFNLGLGPVAELRFYNADGDVNTLGALIYGSEDPIYLDVSFPGFASNGIVSPNDVHSWLGVRKSGPTNFINFISK